jgi:hypothetical protein
LSKALFPKRLGYGGREAASHGVRHNRNHRQAPGAARSLWWDAPMNRARKGATYKDIFAYLSKARKVWFLNMRKYNHENLYIINDRDILLFNNRM